MHRVPFYGMCVSCRSFCSSSIFETMSRRATATAAWDWKGPEDPDQAPGPHPCSAPHQVPPSPPPVSHGRRASGGQARKYPCLRRHTRLTGRLRRSIGGRTRMVCGCKHFCAWLLICVLLYVILPILPIAEEEEIAFDGEAPQHPKP